MSGKTWSSVRYPKGREETAPSLRLTRWRLRAPREKTYYSQPLLLRSPDGLPGKHTWTFQFGCQMVHKGCQLTIPIGFNWHLLEAAGTGMLTISTDPKSYWTGKLETKTLQTSGIESQGFVQLTNPKGWIFQSFPSLGMKGLPWIIG